MNKYLSRAFLVFFLCSSVLFIQIKWSYACSAPASIKIQKPKDRLTTLLRIRAQEQGPNYLFFANGNFNEEVFRYLGTIYNQTKNEFYYVVALKTVWNCSKRATIRLIFFDSNKNYLGHYYLHGSEPTKIENHQFLIFPPTEKHEEFTKIDFSNGIKKENLLINTTLHSFDEKKKGQ